MRSILYIVRIERSRWKTIKCEVCGRPITHCSVCFTAIPSLRKTQEEEVDFKFPAIPIVEVELPVQQTCEQETSSNWVYQTSLPLNKQILIESKHKSSLSQYFDENAATCTCVRDADGNVAPNHNIQRASISLPHHSPYSPKRVCGSYGNYNVEELAKIAVEQQMRAEKRKRRRSRWIRRGIVIGVVVVVILANWDMFYYACRSFLNGIGAVFEIFGLLGDL